MTWHVLDALSEFMALHIIGPRSDGALGSYDAVVPLPRDRQSCKVPGFTTPSMQACGDRDVV